jgi:hypothetical protein
VELDRLVFPDGLYAVSEDEMTTDILNTWKEIAAYLKVSVGYAKRLAKKHDDFPVFREDRVFTTRQALSRWINSRCTTKTP